MAKLFDGDSIGWGNNGYRDGPRFHAQRPLGNWESDNAWDIFGKEGTQVNSLTNGSVSKIKQSSGNNPKIYGTQIKITGIGGYPDVFYTHLKDVQLRMGDRVNVGDKIGKIEKGGQGMPTHVHIGLPYGESISGLVEESGILNRDEDRGKKDYLATGAALVAGGAAAASKGKNSSQPTVTGDVLGAFASDIAKVAVPLGFIGGVSGLGEGKLTEEILRMKELMK